MRTILFITMLFTLTVTVSAQSDYYIKKAQSYQREAEYFQKKAEGYRREAAYYLKKQRGTNERQPTIPSEEIRTAPRPTTAMPRTKWTDTRLNYAMPPKPTRKLRCICVGQPMP